MPRGNGDGGEMTYIDAELIEVIERFQELGDFSTRRRASRELARALKDSNFLLRSQDTGSKWGGDFLSMSSD